MGIEIRALSAGDRTRVSAICSQIWGGHDWVPDEFDRWIAEADGKAIGAESGGLLIGFAHRSWLYPGHAWFEGIRTDPAHRGLGAGRAMTEHLIGAAARDGASTISLSTHVDNEASIHIIESCGFRRVASFAHLELEIDAGAAPGAKEPDVAPVSEAATVRFVDRSGFLALAQRRFPRGWRFFPFDLDPREAVARLGTRIGVRRYGALAALLCLRQPAGGTGPTVLNFGDGEPDDLRRLVRHVHGLYAGRRIEAMVPVHDGREAALLPILRASGYAAEKDGAPAVFAYELNLR